MWKLLLVAFLARVSGAPTAPELPGNNRSNLFGAAGGTNRFLLSPISFNQSGSPIDMNHQPLPFGVSNPGVILYQNFVFNGVVPSGRSSSDPPQAPKGNDYTYTPGAGPPSPPISFNQNGLPIDANHQPMPSGRWNFDPSQAPKRYGYTYTPGVGAHKLNSGPLTWNAARKACNEDGGYLAIINSDEEARVLTEMFRNLGPVIGMTFNNVAFLGIHDLFGDGDWVTIFGESLANTGYKGWLPGQPNNSEGNQHCGTLDLEEGLNDAECTVFLPYFCELTDV